MSLKTSYYVILLILCVVGGITPLATDLYLPAIPKMAESFGVSIEDIQLSVSIFFGGFAIGQLFYGPLSDAFGRKKVILIGSFVFFISTLLCAITDSYIVFICSRLVQALGGAAGAVVVNAVMRDLFKGQQYVKSLSFIMIVTTLAPLLAPILGGWLQIYGYKIIFIILSLISLVSILLVSFGVKETLKTENKQKFHIYNITCNYFEVIKNYKVLGIILAQSFHGAGGFAFIAGSPFVYIELYGVSAEYYGFLFALNIISIMLVTTQSSKFVKLFGVVGSIRFGLSVALIGGFCLLLSALYEVIYLWLIVVPIITYMCCMGIIGACSTSYALGYYSKMSGTVSSLIGSVRFGLGSIVGILLNLNMSYSAKPLAIAIFSCSVLAFLSFYISRLIIKRRIMKKMGQSLFLCDLAK